jgi:TolA-binding protein
MKKAAFFMILALSGMMLTSCAFRSSKHAFGPYSEAEDFYKKGDYPKAIEKYQEYLVGHPQGNMAAIAEYYIAKSHLASGDVVKARESFEQVVKLYPQTSWADFSKEQLENLQNTEKS